MTEELLEPKYAKRKYLSISTLLTYARCPRLYFYKKCGITSVDEPVAALYGSAMHRAIPVAFLTQDREKAMIEFMVEWDESLADKKRNLKNAVRSVDHFIHTHRGGRSLYNLIPPPEGALQLDERNSPYEVAWAVDIGLPVPLVGRFDSFCTHRDTGKKCIWELKTASRANEQFFDQFDMNSQILTYGLVAEIMGHPVEEVMVEGILVDPKKVDNQTQPVRIKAHHLKAQLLWLRFMGSQLLEMERLMEQYEAEGKDPATVFVQNFSMCTAYTHFYLPSWRCDYTELCRTEDWKDQIDIFRIKPDHDFIDLSINKDAIHSSSKSIQSLDHEAKGESLTSTPSV